MARESRAADRPDPRTTRLIFDVVERYFHATRHFQSQFTNYETRVLEYARQRGLDRTQLRLNAQELATLFDFKALEQLRDRHLFALKEASHRLFRGDDHTDAFDRYVSDLFHELSMLKEEHYTVQVYGPQFEAADEDADLETLLDEVHEFYPRRLRTIRTLFQKARARLLAVLPDFGENSILLRSLAMYGDDLVGDVLPGGVDELLAAIYPARGAAWAWGRAAQRFLDGGFETWAGRCCDRVEAAVAKDPSHPDPERMRGELARLRTAIAARVAEAAQVVDA